MRSGGIVPVSLSARQNWQTKRTVGTPITKPSSERKVAFSLENDGRSLR